MSGVLLFAAIFLQCKKMGILSALRVAVAKAPALRRTDVRLVDPRFANKFACQEFCFLLLFFLHRKKNGDAHFAGGLPPHPVHYNAVCENGHGK